MPGQCEWTLVAQKISHLIFITDYNNTIQRQSMNGSELLLNTAERFGMVIAKTQQVSDSPRRLSRPNIGNYNPLTHRVVIFWCTYIHISNVCKYV